MAFHLVVHSAGHSGGQVVDRFVELQVGTPHLPVLFIVKAEQLATVVAQILANLASLGVRSHLVGEWQDSTESCLVRRNTSEYSQL